MCVDVGCALHLYVAVAAGVAYRFGRLLAAGLPTPFAAQLQKLEWIDP
jgi:hypothetical protein